MGKVYLLCGRICSGKSHYSKELQRKTNAVILSPDEATYDLLNNEQGPFYDIFSKRLISYLDKKSVEIAKACANVIYERGLWTKKDRDYIKEYYKNNNVEFEIHYIYITNEAWDKQILYRNELIEKGINKTDFYVNDGLKKKLMSMFEEPSKDEVDVWYSNEYLNRK